MIHHPALASPNERATAVPAFVGLPPTADHGRVAEGVLDRLENAFGQPFALLDVTSGECLRSGADWLNIEWRSRLALCEAVAAAGAPEVIEDCAPLLLIAIPVPVASEAAGLVAVSTFLTDRVTTREQVAAAARAFGVDAEQALRWSGRQQPWSPRAVTQLARALFEGLVHEQRVLSLKTQLRDVSSHLLSTFEELGMLHRLTERLTLSSSEAELTELAMEWLAKVVPAKCLMAVMTPQEESPGGGPQAPTHGVVRVGPGPIDDDEAPQFIERLGPEASTRCLVLNSDSTDSPTWYYPTVRELVSAPIRSGDRVLGWILAINRKRRDAAERDFGPVEASLLSSVAALLAVHAGNARAYREQTDFFASVVRALSSAIDAKDPYTCGHSDRVARISVALARELGCTNDELNTIYLSGLLHDIGKIGIDDNVLRKPGALTPEEYEHIKQHPELGRKILSGVKQLDKVLPVVLHHHEAWDGSGYPAGLAGEACPRLARIVAVADSIDAMASDRPYRKGMPAEKLDRILHEGAGRQWDASVIEAYDAVRDQVRAISNTDKETRSLDVGDWGS